MMTDSWTVTTADSTTITIDVTIGNETQRWVLGQDDVDLSNDQDLLNSIRDFVTKQRQTILDLKTAPAVVSSVVGHAEDF
jgi:hypothetical protein